MFIIFIRTTNANFAIRAIPPIPERPYRILAGMEYFAWLLLWVPIVLMFLLWNLTYLALASTIMFMLFYILAVVVIWRPYHKTWKNQDPGSK